MKIMVPIPEFVATCKRVAMGLASHDMKPILKSLLLTANGDVTLMATDLEVGIKATLPGKIDTEGATCIPGDCARLLDGVKDDETLIEASADDEANPSVISGVGFRFVLPSFRADSFPVFPECKGVPVTVNAAWLANAIRRCKFALRDSSGEMTRRYSASDAMRIEIEGKELRVVATNGKVLIVQRTAIEESAKAACCIPQKSAAIIAGACEGQETVTIAIGKSDAHVVAGKVQVYTRQVEGRYPAWDKQLDMTKTKEFARVPVGVLLPILKHAGYFANEESTRVEFDFSKDKITATKADSSRGKCEVVAACSSSAPYKLVQSASNLRDALASFEPDAEIVLSGNENLRVKIEVDGVVIVMVSMAENKV